MPGASEKLVRDKGYFLLDQSLWRFLFYLTGLFTPSNCNDFQKYNLNMLC